MCAIIDANVVHQVFGEDRPEAGKEFFNWINSGKGKLVVGGKLRKELFGSERFKIWWEGAQKAGRAKFIDDAEVEEETQKFEHNEDYKSDDPHILALGACAAEKSDTIYGMT